MRYRLLLLSLFVLSIASCTLDPIENYEQKDNSVEAYFAETHTKTSFLADDSGFLSWSQGDCISLFSGSGDNGGYKYLSTSSGESVVFEPDGEPYSGSGNFVAVYPYNTANAVSSSGTINAIIPSEQQAVSGNIADNTLLTVGKSNTSSIGFYHVSGGIRFSVSESGITKVVFRSINNEPLSGAVSVEFGADGKPVISSLTNTSSSVTLISESPLNTGVYYYISMAPSTLLKGFSMDFYRGESKFVTTSHNKYIEIKRGVFSSIKQADSQASVSKIKSGKDITNMGERTSNCYVLTEAGDYKIPAFKGNTSQIVGQVKSAEVVWETANTTYQISKGSIISSVDCSGQWVYFSTPSTLKEGNALIAVKDESGKILWSWHIWCVKDDPTVLRQMLTNGSSPTMDRNLGALSKTPGDYAANGLFYQWGRKDPFVGSAARSSNAFMYSTAPFDAVSTDNVTGNMDYATAHPNTFIYSVSSSQDWMTGRNNYDQWSSSKTMYDPCPYGWKIPVGYDRDSRTGQWYGSKYSIDTNNKGALFTLNSGSSWYPCPGYLSATDTESLNKHGLSRLMMAGQLGYYWTSTVSGTATVLEIYMETGKPATVRTTQGGKILSEGRSVRCVAE